MTLLHGLMARNENHRARETVDVRDNDHSAERSYFDFAP